MPPSLSTRDLSDLIGDIYDCALDPARWEPTLEKIRHVLNCHHAFLHLDDLKTRRSVIAKSAGIEQQWLDRQADLMPEVTGILMRVLDSGHSIDEPSVASRFMTAAELSDSSYAQKWGRPQGLVDYMDFFLIQTPTRLASLGLARHEESGSITDSEIETGRLLIPHLRRAVTISNVLDAQTVEKARLSETLDALRVAIILTDENAQILHCNPAATELLNGNGPLREIGGAVSARSAKANAEIHAAITLAADRNNDALGKVGLAVRLNEDGSEPLVAHVLPVSSLVRKSHGPRAAVAAVFVSSALNEAASARAIAAAYGLTNAEARILEGLLSGRTISELANQLGISTPTARTHLSHVFAKTGVPRQSGLMRLAASISPITR